MDFSTFLRISTHKVSARMGEDGELRDPVFTGDLDNFAGHRFVSEGAEWSCLDKEKFGNPALSIRSVSVDSDSTDMEARLFDKRKIVGAIHYIKIASTHFIGIKLNISDIVLSKLTALAFDQIFPIFELTLNTSDSFYLKGEIDPITIWDIDKCSVIGIEDFNIEFKMS